MGAFIGLIPLQPIRRRWMNEKQTAGSTSRELHSSSCRRKVPKRSHGPCWLRGVDDDDNDDDDDDDDENDYSVVWMRINGKGQS